MSAADRTNYCSNCEEVRRGQAMSELIQGLPLPLDVIEVLLAARRFLAAVDACDREAKRPKESQSSAPMVRYITELSALRKAAGALKWREPKRQRKAKNAPTE